MKENRIVLSKDSSESDLKRYFTAVHELQQGSEEFPVDLDEVWMLAYKEKGKAVRALKKDYVENEDYISFAQNGKREVGGTQTKIYKLSVSCLEFFIAKKVRPVFEVYRQVFHKTIEQRQLTPAEMFLQSAQFMVEQERKNRELEQKMITAQATADTANARLDALEAERKEATNALHQEVLSTEAVPEETLRSKICALVYKFSSAVNISPREAWHKVYDALFRCYRIKLKGRKQPCDKNLLDTAERTGCLNQIYNIISDMIRSTEQKEKIITVTITH